MLCSLKILYATAVATLLVGCAHSGPQFMNEHGSRPLHYAAQGLSHQGVDIIADIGTPVLAARDGQVTWSSDRSDGLWLHPYILIRHTGDVDIYYYHIDRIQVKPDDTIKQGQIIAYTARTGQQVPNQPGVFQGRPHLHMETRDPSGKRFDPKLLPFTCPDKGGEWWWPVGCGR